jgi:two-component system OmpR family response regulator
MAKILMVDDDVHFAKVIARCLSQEGHTVQTAADGAQALRLIREFSPDLLVLDVALPLVTGVQLGAQTHLPILFLSGRDLERVEHLNRPNVRFLKKPADLDEIMQETRTLLAQTL